MSRRVFFIDNNENKISNDEIEFHEPLIELIFEKYPELQKKFKQSGINSKYVFLLEEGYLAGTDSERYKEITFLKSKISERAKEILLYYYEEGYNLHDISEEIKYELER